jgi:hypothetical protein
MFVDEKRNAINRMQRPDPEVWNWKCLQATAMQMQADIGWFVSTL